MDRKSFLKGLVVAGATLPCCFSAAETKTEVKTGKCEDGSCKSDAGAVRQFLSDFLKAEDATLDRDALHKLMRERGRACCRNLDFRQKMLADSQGSMEKLVELMGKVVGPENCRREGNTITYTGITPTTVPSPTIVRV